MYSYMGKGISLGFAKAAVPTAQPGQVLEQLRACARLFHHDAATETAYLRWTRAYLRWQHKHNKAWQLHESGAVEVNAFLAALASRQGLSPARHRQALHALLFLHRHVLGRDLLAP